MRLDVSSEVPAPDLSPLVHIGAVPSEDIAVDDECWCAQFSYRSPDILRRQFFVQILGVQGVKAIALRWQR